MDVISKLKNVKKVIAFAKAIIRYGGINTVSVTQIDYGEILKGRKILITGAGSGIGFAIAKKCVECGATVVITGRSEYKLREALKCIGNLNAKFMLWDISDINAMTQKLNECIELLGGEIDVLVNNAGVHPQAFFPNVTEEEWNRIYETNSKGTFFISEFLCKRWMNNMPVNYRKIINIDSQGGFVGATYPYRMSKWDIRGLTEGLGLKMAEYGVLVNGIAPGVVKTNMQEFSLKQGNNTFCNQNALKRVSLPEEVAELAVFMISDACNFMVGQTILIDGGYSLK